MIRTRPGRPQRGKARQRDGFRYRQPVRRVVPTRRVGDVRDWIASRTVHEGVSTEQLAVGPVIDEEEAIPLPPFARLCSGLPDSMAISSALIDFGRPTNKGITMCGKTL